MKPRSDYHDRSSWWLFGGFAVMLLSVAVIRLIDYREIERALEKTDAEASYRLKSADTGSVERQLALQKEFHEEMLKTNREVLRLTRQNRMVSYFALAALLLLGYSTYSILRRLRKAENKYRLLFDLSPMPMWFVDVQGYRILEVNEAAERKYGYSEEEFLQMTPFDIRNITAGEERDQIERAVRQSAFEGGSYAARARHYRKDGQMMEVDINSKTIRIDNKKVFLVSLNDVTEKENREREMARAVIETQESERRVLGAELHDNIGQILASTQLYLGMVKAPEDFIQEKYLAEARKSLSEASAEVRSISHRIAPAFLEHVTLTEAIHKLLDDMNPGKKSIVHFEFESSILAATIRPEIKLNIYRIIQEQLKNIRKYASATEIWVDLKENNNRIYLTIADNGRGFDLQAVRPGMGLMNMRKRAELFAGRFEIESEPGRGCQVRVEIPLMVV